MAFAGDGVFMILESKRFWFCFSIVCALVIGLVVIAASYLIVGITSATTTVTSNAMYVAKGPHPNIIEIGDLLRRNQYTNINLIVIIDDISVNNNSQSIIINMQFGNNEKLVERLESFFKSFEKQGGTFYKRVEKDKTIYDMVLE